VNEHHVCAPILLRLAQFVPDELLNIRHRLVVRSQIAVTSSEMQDYSSASDKPNRSR
jgi:hypothetical protein